jgi:hypothetical protein
MSKKTKQLYSNNDTNNKKNKSTNENYIDNIQSNICNQSNNDEIDDNIIDNNVNNKENENDNENNNENNNENENSNSLKTTNINCNYDPSQINEIIINDLSINNKYTNIHNFDELKDLYKHLKFIDKFNNTNYSSISHNLLNLFYNPNSFVELMNNTLNNFENNGNIQLFDTNDILHNTIQNIKLLYKPFIINQCYLFIYYYNILIPYINEYMSLKIFRIIDLNITKILYYREKIDHLYQKQKNILSNYDIHIDNII